MATIRVNGTDVEFNQGDMILQAALRSEQEIPYYCYHDGLSIVACCRICLVEVWAPNPRNDNKLEPIPKLLPACQTPCQEGQVVYSESPKALANQKAVMEYLLINHPLDCPVCDQAGECELQDYSYKYGRGVSRFEEDKIKQPKKDLGPNVLLYADRCIMCTRCVRFTREVTGTAELCIEGRGATEQIEVFPGRALDNELASNVIDLCPVGALLDKDFLFTKRVWDLTSSPSIDPVTSSGDNIWIDHADGRIHRLRPRENPEVNKWWITDEVRYGWRFAHDAERLTQASRRAHGALAPCTSRAAIEAVVEGVKEAVDGGGRAALLVSPMLTCEDAHLLATAVRAIDHKAILAVGPVPVDGEDRIYPPGADESDANAFVSRAEKAPNARGVKRVLDAVAGDGGVLDYRAFETKLAEGSFAAVVLTGGYPTDWATPALRSAVEKEGVFCALVDALDSPLAQSCDAIIPGAVWAEKAGTFENAAGRLQAFEAAIPPVEGAAAEAQIGLDMLREATGIIRDGGQRPVRYNAAEIRKLMAKANPSLAMFETDVHLPPVHQRRETDMKIVDV